MIKTTLRIATIGILSVLGGLVSQGVLAHPMGNFSISHYTRLEAGEGKITLHYVLDQAEIPTQSERMAMDTDNNGKISEQEKEAYLNAKSLTLRNGLTLTVNGKPIVLDVKPQGMEFRPGAGGLDTLRLTLQLTGKLPADRADKTYQISYKDGNYTERTGWKEVVAVSGASGVKLANSTVPTTDVSKELNVYPTDPGVSPLQVSEANFTVSSQVGAVPLAQQTNSPITSSSSPQQPNPRTPQDAFTQSIATKDLTLGGILGALFLAFVFGAFHAMSPGHGKAMVAAYLVGAKGTAKHAIFLGGVVTVTHTIGVFALGLIALFASRYIVPETLYPILSALSGVAIVVVGVNLMRQRWAVLAGQGHSHSIPHTHDHDHSHDPSHTHDHDHEHLHTHDHDHSHTHDHDHHSHDHHSHGAGVVHDHGDGNYHSHDIPEELSFKTLLLLGITGGALPCPSALVVMLGAIALHRVAFGLGLITAFSLGLAVVLTAIGLLVVYAREFLGRLPARNSLNGKLFARLPLASAAFVTAIGLVLVVRAVSGGKF